MSASPAVWGPQPRGSASPHGVRVSRCAPGPGVTHGKGQTDRQTDKVLLSRAWPGVGGWLVAGSGNVSPRGHGHRLGSCPTWGHPSGSPTPAGCPCPHFSLEPPGSWRPGTAPTGGSVSPWGTSPMALGSSGFASGYMARGAQKGWFLPPSCRYPCPQPVTLLGDGQCQPGQGTGTLCPLPSAVRGRGLQQAARTTLGYSYFIFM